MKPRMAAVLAVSVAVLAAAAPLWAGAPASTLPSSASTSAASSQPSIQMAQASSDDAASGSAVGSPPSSAAPSSAAPAAAEPVDLHSPADARPSHERPLDKWYIQPSISLWAPSINGTVGARGLTNSVDVSFIDVLKESDSLLGIGGTLEFGKGKLGGYVNGFYAKIGVEEPTPFGDASIVNRLGIMGFGITYEIGRWPMEYTARSDHPARNLMLNLYGGGRYTNVEIEYDFVVLPSRSRDKGWVDPMVGAKMVLPLAPSWSIVGYGEVGGFGAASDFAWTAGVLASWDFHLGRFPSSLQFGYLAVGDDYTSGSGDNRFIWDTILHGPILNFQMRF